MSSDGEEEMCTPPEITEKAKITTDGLLPAKSRERYEIVYQKFMDWRVKNKVQTLSENVMLAYFGDLSKDMKPSSLWATYSMLRATINIRNNTNIASYSKLLALLKRKSDGFRSKKSKTLAADEINQFLKSAPDNTHLLTKVILIFGISGACRKQELRNIKTEHIEDTGKSLIIKIPDSKTKTQRSFIVPEVWYPTCKKYMNLRPSGADENCLPFFLNYQHEKCTKQCVGINKFGTVPKRIAEFLGLDNPKQYTGHCFRRSSATILVDAGGDLLALKRHGGWRSSTVAEGYVDNSTKNKIDNAMKITSAIYDSETISNHNSVRDINAASSSGTNLVHHNTLEENSATSIFNNNISMAPSNTTPVFHNCSVTINNYYHKM